MVDAGGPAAEQLLVRRPSADGAEGGSDHSRASPAGAHVAGDDPRAGPAAVSRTALHRQVGQCDGTRPQVDRRPRWADGKEGSVATHGDAGEGRGEEVRARQCRSCRAPSSQRRPWGGRRRQPHAPPRGATRQAARLTLLHRAGRSPTACCWFAAQPWTNCLSTYPAPASEVRTRLHFRGAAPRQVDRRLRSPPGR